MLNVGLTRVRPCAVGVLLTDLFSEHPSLRFRNASRPCFVAAFAKMASIPEESKCQYNYLGNSGLRVSNVCLGTMTFGVSIVSEFW